MCAHVHEVYGYISLPLLKPTIHAACETMAILTTHTHTQPINSVEKEPNVSWMIKFDYIFGASLSKPHTSVTALRKCVYLSMLVCLFGPTTYLKF